MSPDPAAALTVLSKGGDESVPGHLPIDPMPRKVLVLEDDTNFQATVGRFLTANGFEVVSVPNGAEGVPEVLTSDFDLILCDVRMPTLPGDQFYRAVEENRPHLCKRFVFMTGYRHDSKISEFVSGTGAAMLIKPFPMDDLLELIAFIELRGRLMAA